MVSPPFTSYFTYLALSSFSTNHAIDIDRYAPQLIALLRRSLPLFLDYMKSLLTSREESGGEGLGMVNPASRYA
jgi:hypothetical protein